MKQLHPYTQALISSIPLLEPGGWQDDTVLKGELSSPVDPRPGCRFAPRCSLVKEYCLQQDPPLVESATGRYSACVRAGEMV
ncbi:MAG TPA: hypothetical protein PLG79_09285 [Spirochaetales bacterium]|nr:hypothetical protein [Spirochaetales bacterium]HOV38901.1 hypothetical protein [Spirochaetales bacterium]